jgi:hypothetical protein
MSNMKIASGMRSRKATIAFFLASSIEASAKSEFAEKTTFQPNGGKSCRICRFSGPIWKNNTR